MKNATLTLVLTCACMAIKCYAVVISADVSNTITLTDEVLITSPAKGTLLTFAINGGVCLDNVSIKINGESVTYGNIPFTKVNDCKFTQVVNHVPGYGFYFKYYGTATNSRTYSVSPVITLSFNGGASVYRTYPKIPSARTCSATVNNLTIGNIVLGSSPTSINLPISISGSAGSKSLVISGTDIQSDGKLNLGGSSSGVKVYPASNYISGATWNAGSSSGSIPLTVDASAGKVGTWTSSLLATLTCS